MHVQGEEDKKKQSSKIIITAFFCIILRLSKEKEYKSSSYF